MFVPRRCGKKIPLLFFLKGRARATQTESVKFCKFYSRPNPRVFSTLPRSRRFETMVKQFNIKPGVLRYLRTVDSCWLQYVCHSLHRNQNYECTPPPESISNALSNDLFLGSSLSLLSFSFYFIVLPMSLASSSMNIISTSDLPFNVTTTTMFRFDPTT